ncbi:(2Fe-2S)-binding protein [Marinobacter bryozoorum]|uniref:(2Fe-2S)-binding protein n=1 Tax=Marinobacter bryozoorum TaxID=256324 RepID=UPI0020038F5B|nr:(2Fe-2S)-binding protein [Marinobacter bryozoorum]MCK7543965.1 (2Fe-2S)-binding protein [Marinobacter bryozoorum]
MARAEAGTDRLADYHNLLARHHLDRNALLKRTLSAANRQQPALFSLAQLLANPSLLAKQVLEDYPETEHPRLHRARVSVLHQSLALQIIGPLVIQLFRDGSSIELNPERILLCREDSSVEGHSRWHHAAGSQERLEPDEFIRVLSNQMQHWYPVFRQHFGVSPGSYWSSVGLALGAPYSLVWNQVDADELCRQASGWLTRFECEANRYIDWIPTHFSQQRCAIPQRRGCCLKYLLPEGGYCGTCGVHRKERMR